jgi:putative selenate reductase
MSDRMRVIPFDQLVNWIIEEYRREKTIFGIAEKYFFRSASGKDLHLHGERLGSPLGPAAGPHTQLAQNLATAYLCGGRYFELKTVQILDRLDFAKPCINAADEGYNTEWSTELSIEEALGEYIKGWFLLHLLGRELFDPDQRNFIFNMSIGYDLEGIRSTKVDHFIEGLKEASSTGIFHQCRAILKKEAGRFSKISEDYIDGISPEICRSVALSTMHGCPPPEIEAICKHLLLEKKLHTTVKLNPTLLGYDFVRSTLDQMGYGYIKLAAETFNKDLQYSDALSLLERLIALAAECDLEFGIKISNTLPVLITRAELPGEQMYLSGKPLYALAINLAERLARDFAGQLKISYSGGADRSNTAAILETGIKPVTMVTTLLKPSGYRRLTKLAEIAEQAEMEETKAGITLDRLKATAETAINAAAYRKKEKDAVPKAAKVLPLFDCRDSCSICTAVCPNRSNVAVAVQGADFKFGHQILHLDGSCNECGNCATFCPEGGKPYLEKPTLFRDASDFDASCNSGFVVVGEGPEKLIKVRFENQVMTLPPGQWEESNDKACDPALLQLIRVILSNYNYLC